MKIKEQLEVLNATLLQINRQIAIISDEKKQIECSFSDSAKQIEKKYDRKKSEINSSYQEIMNCYDIVSDNTDAKIRKKNISAICPDLSKLTELLSTTDLNKKNDPNAIKIVDLVSSYLLFLDQKKEELEIEKKKELNQNSKNMDNSLYELKKKRLQITRDLEKFLKGDQFTNLFIFFAKLKKRFEITNRTLSSWTEKQNQDSKTIMFGFRGTLLNVPDDSKQLIKEKMGIFYDINSSKLAVPCGYSTNKSIKLFVDYSEKNEKSVKSGIQAVILNYICHFKLSHISFSLIDHLFYSDEIVDSLSEFIGISNKFFDAIPTDEKKAKSYYGQLAQYYKSSVRPLLNSCSVYDYNSQSDKHNCIPFRIIIINRRINSISFSEESDLKYLINNANKLGITFIFLNKHDSQDIKGKDSATKVSLPDSIQIVSDSDGKFYFLDDNQWIDFKWLTPQTDSLPQAFVTHVLDCIKPQKKGTNYFTRFQSAVPVRSTKKRKPIQVPFAVREDDSIVECSFEKDLFAAYMMGASGSGKSTLLHVIIAGLLINYHPDELEIWLADFLKVEFKKYINHPAPHIKYVLLEKSEDMVCDLIDRIYAVKEQRFFAFSQNGWVNLNDVPLDVYMPAIFIIIDEFADMSDLIREAKNHRTIDYSKRLEELLRECRKVGIKFIFASQKFVSENSGLNDNSKNNIQQRIALKNDYQEIKHTLALASEMITPQIEHDMYSLPEYESLFKWRDDNKIIHIEHLNNMYIEDGVIERLTDDLSKSFSAIDDWSLRNNRNYLFKNPVYVDGGTPQSFDSQLKYYLLYERNKKRKLRQGDYSVFPGIPRSLVLANPFIVGRATFENLLLVGGSYEDEASLMLSVLKCLESNGVSISIWSHSRNIVYEEYYDSILNQYNVFTKIEDICNEISLIYDNVRNKNIQDKIILVLGYEQLYSEIDLKTEDAKVYCDQNKKSTLDEPETFEEFCSRIRVITDKEEKRKAIEEYNLKVAIYNERQVKDSQNQNILSANSNLQWVIPRASSFGVHFFFIFKQAVDFENSKLNSKWFKHKIAFKISRNDAINIFGVGNANLSELEDGVFIYNDGIESSSYRTHLHPLIPNRGWKINEQGKVVQEL